METKNAALVKHQWGGRIFAIIVALVALVLIVVTLNPGVNATSAQEAEKKNPTTTALTASNSGECKPEFVQASLNHEGNKVDSDFEKDYDAALAASPDLPEAVANLLLKKAGQDAQFLAIRTYELGLHEDANNWSDLVDGNCLSEKGQKLHAQYEGVLNATATVITEDEAPSNAVNSGVNDDVFGVANSSGIHGDRKAIKVTLKDGTSVYILVRCGNGVFPGNPGLPEVPTDNPPPPKAPECPPDMPYGTPPVCKDSPAKDPAQNGNAPIGGGPNANPGPGKFIPPAQMEQPPSTPRVNPAPPAPEPPAPQKPTPSNPKPTPVPTPDPAPAPPPRPSAPPPTAPETGCDDSVPGVVC